jgi:putative SOS response-associated peptidase YedK
MCGRFTLIRISDFTDLFPWISAEVPDWRARYNIAPTQPVPAVTNRPRPDGRHHVEIFRWGLVPAWAKDVAIGNKMINARAETLLDKPAFRTLVKRRRCVVPASGFYEWRKDTNRKAKTPMYIRLRDQPAMALAGLWDVWCGADGSELPTFTVITTGANDLMRPIHDRMPAILSADAVARWLAPGELTVPPVDLLKPFETGRMEAFAVSSRVNSPANDEGSLIDPCEPPPAEPRGLFD